MIQYLQRLNENMPYIHFKMEAIKPIFTLVTPNCYMAKLDIQDVYYSVPILPEHQKYLKFYLRGKFCQSTCLANRLCSDPRKFTKLLKPPLSYLWLQQVTVAGSLDDLITLGRRFIKCERNINLIVTLLDCLGFVFHPNKSIFVPTRSVEYLCFVIDSESMTISLTKKQKNLYKTVMSRSASGRISCHQENCVTTR